MAEIKRIIGQTRNYDIHELNCIVDVNELLGKLEKFPIISADIYPECPILLDFGQAEKATLEFSEFFRRHSDNYQENIRIYWTNQKGN